MNRSHKTMRADMHGVPGKRKKKQKKKRSGCSRATVEGGRQPTTVDLPSWFATGLLRLKPCWQISAAKWPPPRSLLMHYMHRAQPPFAGRSLSSLVLCHCGKVARLERGWRAGSPNGGEWQLVLQISKVEPNEGGRGVQRGIDPAAGFTSETCQGPLTE